MGFAAALSEHPDPAIAVGEVAGQVLETLGEAPDVALLFVTIHHERSLRLIVDALRKLLDPAVLAGCVTGAVVGSERGVEDAPAISVWAGVTGGALGVRVGVVSVGPGEAAVSGWPDADAVGFDPSALVLLADPNTFPGEAFLQFVDEDRPGLPVVGGFASAGRPAPLIFDGELVSGGAVGVLLGPGVEVETVVSQGCRPIGEPWAVTASHDNVVESLGGRPPLDRLRILAENVLTDEEVALVNSGALHVGRVIDEHKAAFGRGDFLVRNIVGADQASGAIAIGDLAPVGTTLQFHLRDAAAASEDLRLLLTGRTAEAALMFTCNGRGSHTFGSASHDPIGLSDAIGMVPVAGFFAAGEFGPVGGRNFLHGFTASIALVRERSAAR